SPRITRLPLYRRRRPPRQPGRRRPPLHLPRGRGYHPSPVAPRTGSPPRTLPMSEPLDALPVDPPPADRRPRTPPPPPAARGWGFSGCLLGLSLLLNVVAVVAVLAGCLGLYPGTAEDRAYPETHVAGD